MGSGSVGSFERMARFDFFEVGFAAMEFGEVAGVEDPNKSRFMGRSEPQCGECGANGLPIRWIVYWNPGTCHIQCRQAVQDRRFLIHRLDDARRAKVSKSNSGRVPMALSGQIHVRRSV